MLHFKSIGTPLVLLLALFAMSGCEQAEKSAQQMLNQAAESAKEAIDKTNDAAQQALSDATGSASTKKPGDDADDAPQRDASAKEI